MSDDYASKPMVNLQTGEEIPVLLRGPRDPKIQSDATSTAGVIFGMTVVGFIFVLAVMSLIKIGMVWFA